MANINLTFNETTYNFLYCKSEKNKPYEYYTIYINGELNTSYILEEGYIKTGIRENEKVDKIFILYWKSFSAGVHITNPNDLEEIVKVITYINKNK